MTCTTWRCSARARTRSRTGLDRAGGLSGADDQRAAAMVREMICDGPIQLDSVLFDVLDAVGKGFSATEIMWDTTGREWCPAQLKWRDPRWFAFDWIWARKYWCAR